MTGLKTTMGLDTYTLIHVYLTEWTFLVPFHPHAYPRWPGDKFHDVVSPRPFPTKWAALEFIEAIRRERNLKR